jgi:hypothetical protein
VHTEDFTDLVRTLGASPSVFEAGIMAGAFALGRSG